MKPARALTSAAIATAIGAAVAAAGSDGGTRLGDDVPLFALCVGLAFAVNWVVFVPSYLARTEHFYDLTGSLTYLSVIGAALALTDERDARTWLMAGLVAVWALRLGTFLFRRVRRAGRDTRFDRIKTNPAQFFMSWTLQGLWVSLTAAAALAAIAAPADQPLGAIGIVGLGVWLAGFAIEATADRQKSAFRADPANEGAFITTGLWAWSRHPNYFGEIVLWCGVALLALPTLEGWRYATLVSPVFVYVLLTRVSGLPMLEAGARKRWGDDPAYRAYVERTPVLVPRPPS